MLLDEASDLGCSVAELCEQHGGILAQQRRRAVAPHRSAREAHRGAELAHRPYRSMWRIPVVVPGEQVRVGEDLAEVLDRGARHSRFAQRREPVHRLSGLGGGLNRGGKRFGVAMTATRVGVALVFQKALQAESLA